MSIVTSRILIPIGFSDQSMVALGQAFNLAKIKKTYLNVSEIYGKYIIE